MWNSNNRRLEEEKRRRETKRLRDEEFWKQQQQKKREKIEETLIKNGVFRSSRMSVLEAKIIPIKPSITSRSGDKSNGPSL